MRTGRTPTQVPGATVTMRCGCEVHLPDQHGESNQHVMWVSLPKRPNLKSGGVWRCRKCAMSRTRKYSRGESAQGILGRFRHLIRVSRGCAKRNGCVPLSTSAEDIARAWESSGGTCQCCHRPVTLTRDGGLWAVVDHNHETGVFRAILCNNCNVIEGHLRMIPEHLRGATLKRIELLLKK